VLACAAAAPSPPCSCDMDWLRAELRASLRDELRASLLDELRAELRTELQSMMLAELNSVDGARLAELRVDLQQEQALPLTSSGTLGGAGDNASADATSGTTSSRRLSGAGPTVLAHKSAYHFHEFPANHNCPNIGGSGTYRRELPLDANSAVTWRPSPLLSDSTVALVSVGTDWAASQISSYPAPFKFVHDAACSAAPSMTLQLNTTIDGTLVVGGVDILARLDAIERRSTLRALKCRGTSSGAAGKCLGRDTSTTNWMMKTCDWSHNEIQLQWYGEQILGAATTTDRAMCMRRQSSDDNLISAYCQGGDDKSFYFDGEQLKNRQAGPSKCVQCGLTTDDSNDDVRVLDCVANEPAQAWYWTEPIN